MKSEGFFKWAARISYVGTDYCGWQKQRAEKPEHEGELIKKPSVQRTIERAIERITSEVVSVVGSGRTDSGVHAAGQVIHFVLKKKDWDLFQLWNGMNSLLRPKIQVLHLQRVPDDFHAQRTAVKKQYSYYFQQGPCALPHLAPCSWWIRKELDREGMQAALSQLVGRHDFKPFQASGAKPGETVREILEAQVEENPIFYPGGFEKGSPFRLLRVRVVGTGFLKQMVRGIAGTLLQVGERRRGAHCMREILDSQDRSLVGPTAPARALWLERVWYPESSGWNGIS